jgi:glycosyltransferase involved in cell wall biosynthesis
MPHFSVVVPLYNRRDHIGPLLDSCLSQDFQGFEVVVVDDGSTDDSCRVVTECTDPRVRLIRHERNQGMGPARNTGVAAAHGEWIIPFNSDHELLPGTLSLIHERTLKTADDIGRLAFMYAWDDGKMSPEPPLTHDVIDYKGYMRWMAGLTGRSDIFYCYRASTFDTVRWPDSNGYDVLFHANFARAFKTETFPEAVALERTDAGNRISSSWRGWIRRSADFAKHNAELLSIHGEAMKEASPDLYFSYVKWSGVYGFLSGNRRKGFAGCARYLRARPFELSAWFTLLVGPVSRGALAMAVAARYGR